MSDIVCPLPLDHDTIQLAHGGGGRRTRELIERIFEPAFGTPDDARHDAAVLSPSLGPGERIAVTTDSYVVAPPFFPGGDIGSLAVHGTINDLAMGGARPIALTASFIIEAGTRIDLLQRVAASAGAAAQQAGVRIVSGDTKVVDNGCGDGVFITTTGVGAVPAGVDVRPERIAPGDAIILSGDVARHGIAVMSARDALAIEGLPGSDSAPVHEAVARLVAAVDVHCLRDATRGGLATVLAELAADSDTELRVNEADVPLHEAVRGACELLGLEPLYVACEGRFVAFVAESDVPAALHALRGADGAPQPVCIGRVIERRPARGRAVLLGALGADRVLDLPSGEQLPRIC